MEVSSHSLLLLQQLNIQREFGFLCDCTVAIGNVYFKAHRAVLAAFSNYFKMIFIHQSSECIKIQPTDIQPDVFSYLLHIMYTGTGPKQQVDQSRLQEGIKFLHAYQLCRRSAEGQDATCDSAKMSNLYGIQISSQPAPKTDSSRLFSDGFMSRGLCAVIFMCLFDFCGKLILLCFSRRGTGNAILIQRSIELFQNSNIQVVPYLQKSI
uniref:Zinc finger and BTB domain containing 25 n=1 Tax=Scleropages formosus TaxID=113540 RepID=A0A8C9SWJ1_SCLFO